MSIQEKGNISIHTENIFPIIKKFLYSDNEIFLRELVSNAVDATQKIKRLASLGQYNGGLGNLRVEVAFDDLNYEAKRTTEVEEVPLSPKSNLSVIETKLNKRKAWTEYLGK